MRGEGVNNGKNNHTVKQGVTGGGVSGGGEDVGGAGEDATGEERRGLFTAVLCDLRDKLGRTTGRERSISLMAAQTVLSVTRRPLDMPCDLRFSR